VAHWQSIEKPKPAQATNRSKGVSIICYANNPSKQSEGRVNTVDGYDRLVDNGLKGFIEDKGKNDGLWTLR